MLKIVSFFIVIAVSATVLTNCAATPGYGPGGSLFISTTNGLSGSGDGKGAKTAEACAHSILGWVGVGGKDVATIAAGAGITNIKSVNAKTFGVLGLYASLCTVVSGD